MLIRPLAIIALGVALTAGCSASTTNHNQTSPLVCPKAPLDKTELAVPTRPQGVNGHARLVPDQAPTTVVVCSYVRGLDGPYPYPSRTATPSAQPTQALSSAARLHTSRTELTGGFSALVTQLSWLTPGSALDRSGCLDVAISTDADSYLIGLTYPGGREWVAVAGDHCAGATNGEFSTSVNVLESTSAAAITGAWPAIRTTACGGIQARLGEQSKMVPPGAIGLTICEQTPGLLQQPAKVIDVSNGAPSIVAALNALPTIPRGSGCNGVPSGTTYRLHFQYKNGPDAVVDVLPFCNPGIDNEALQARDASTVVRAIKALH